MNIIQRLCNLLRILHPQRSITRRHSATHPRPLLLANESRPIPVTLFLPNQLSPRHPGQEHWVQLSPFGDFGNVNGKSRVIQRFRKEDAHHICDEFNSAIRRVTQPLGMPFYIGHPDHPHFKGQPGHEDTRSYGRGKEMQVRHDPACPACAAFANSKPDRASDPSALDPESGSAPCQEHGLFVRMHWNDDGARLIANESFHGHSVNWAAIPSGMENGIQVFRPVRVKSAGFTNEPNIPVRPASLANAADSISPLEPSAAETAGREQQPAQYTVPPRLKLLAGFKEEEDVSMDQVIAALEKARPVDKANEVHRADLERQLTNERRARATSVVDSLVKTGRVITRDRAACIEQLCNAGDQFDQKAAELGNTHSVVKTEAKSRGLAGQHAKVVEGERERAARLQELMDARQKDFPNETYEERFRAVANSNEGAQLFVQMRRSGAEE